MKLAKQDNQDLLARPSNVRFADVAHQTLLFDKGEESEKLILELIDTKWMQRLRHIRQTGNTYMVYMFAEHSRFGHSLGVAYLASMLMKNLMRFSPKQVAPYRNAVAAAALLHDVGHVAPGSHLGEKVWAPSTPGQHEKVSMRVIKEDEEIFNILQSYSPELPEQVCQILSESPEIPSWASAIISGGGWNADRGNWAIVDSSMCSVTYGRYNVPALIDAFRLSSEGELVLQESRLDALTHFFVARDSMYRQVYQHRVLQVADALTKKIVVRLREILKTNCADSSLAELHRVFGSRNIAADETMAEVLLSGNYATSLSLQSLFQMSEHWWTYHLGKWCFSEDEVLRDLSLRIRDRRLFKTIRIEGDGKNAEALEKRIRSTLEQHGFDSSYYLIVVDNADKHRGKKETPPRVLLDSGEIVSASEVEPLIPYLMEPPKLERRWLAVPKRVKADIGRLR